MLQFVLIKPFTSLLAIIFDHYGLYHEGHFELSSTYLYLAIINNLSISLSLYCLVLFYTATEDRLKPFSPLPKFLCVKAILFFSFWQTCAFTLMQKANFPGGVFSRKDTATIYQSVIISVELVFAAIAQAIAFDYKPFIQSRSQIELVNLTKASNEKKANVLRNIGNVLNVKDVINDAHNTFIKGGKDSEQENEINDVL